MEALPEATQAASQAFFDIKSELMPTLTIVAGPNGSGKSTLTRLARESFQDIPILDPDAIAKMLSAFSPDHGSAMDAGRVVLLRAQSYLEKRVDFLVETTLSGNTYLRMMREAKSLGYLVVLIYVGTTSVEINLQRVEQRVANGGHDVPEEDQRRRYPRSMANMRKAFEIADEAVLFDNSEESHRRLAVKDVRGVVVYSPLPEWVSFVRPN